MKQVPGKRRPKDRGAQEATAPESEEKSGQKVGSPGETEPGAGRRPGPGQAGSWETAGYSENQLQVPVHGKIVKPKPGEHGSSFSGSRGNWGKAKVTSRKNGHTYSTETALQRMGGLEAGQYGPGQNLG